MRTDDGQALSENLWGLVFELAHRMREHAEARMAELDLSPPLALALVHLGPLGQAPMSDLADGLRCHASNIIQSFRKLFPAAHDPWGPKGPPPSDVVNILSAARNERADSESDTEPDVGAAPRRWDG